MMFISVYILCLQVISAIEKYYKKQHASVLKRTYGQEIQQSHTTDHPMAPQGRAKTRRT